MKKPSSLKLLYFFSLIMTVGSFVTLGYGYYNFELITVIMSLPIFVVFYPITLIGTGLYIFKKVLQQKSVLELLEMTGASSGIGNLMGGLTENNDEDDGTEE